MAPTSSPVVANDFATTVGLSTATPKSTENKESMTGVAPQDTKFVVSSKEEDSFDLLAKRFEALKKR